MLNVELWKLLSKEARLWKLDLFQMLELHICLMISDATQVEDSPIHKLLFFFLWLKFLTVTKLPRSRKTFLFISLN